MQQFADIEQEHGLPPGYLAMTGQIESGLNPQSHNELSGADGMFQFIPSTAKEYGLRYGKDTRDPVKSANAAAAYAEDNANALRTALGRDPTAGEIYLAHQQGTQGAIALLSNPSVAAGQLVKPRSIIANGGDPSAPASQFVAHWGEPFSALDARPRWLSTAQARSDDSPDPLGSWGGSGKPTGKAPPVASATIDPLGSWASAEEPPAGATQVGGQQPPPNELPAAERVAQGFSDLAKGDAAAPVGSDALWASLAAGGLGLGYGGAAAAAGGTALKTLLGSTLKGAGTALKYGALYEAAKYLGFDEDIKSVLKSLMSGTGGH